MEKARKPFHPALKRSGMRLNGDLKTNGTIYYPSAPKKGKIKFGSMYGGTSKKNEKINNVHPKLERISSRGEVDKHDREESNPK